MDKEKYTLQAFSKGLYVRLGAYSILCLPAVINLTMTLIFFSDGTYTGYVLDWIIIAFALATIVAMTVSGVRFKKSICNNSVNVYTRMKRFYLLVWTCFAGILITNAFAIYIMGYYDWHLAQHGYRNTNYMRLSIIISFVQVVCCFAVLLGKMILVMKNEKKRRGRNGTIKRANDFYK